jgi:DNA modification methylase
MYKIKNCWGTSNCLRHRSRKAAPGPGTGRNRQVIENRILPGNSTDILKTLPEQSVDCRVTSPPYYMLRDYGGIYGQIGNETTPEEYIDRLLAVFRETRRVLKDGGSLWVNIGDSYNGSGKNGNNPCPFSAKQATNTASHTTPATRIKNYPRKSLLGIPWRFALRMIDEGWILRQDIIWHKKSPMPESVKDRFCGAHEYLFFFTKRQKYFFDYRGALEVAATPPDKNRIKIYSNVQDGHTAPRLQCPQVTGGAAFRLKRDVWHLANDGIHEEHYATFPESLIRPCIVCGCPENGIVLDPFMGSGTTAVVAMKHFRKYIGIEINPEYIEIAGRRIAKERGLFDGC